MQMCQVPLSSTERKQAPKGAHWLHATELWRDSSSRFGFLPQRPLRVKGIAAEVHRVPRLQSSHGPAWLGAEGQRLQATLDPGDVLLRSRCRAMSMTLQRYEVGVGETICGVGSASPPVAAPRALFHATGPQPSNCHGLLGVNSTAPL